MKKIKFVRPLNNEGVSDAVKAVSDFLTGGSCDPKDVVRVTLSVEESLLTLKNALPEGDAFTVRCAGFLKTVTVTLTVSGKNVTEQFTDDVHPALLLPQHRIACHPGGWNVRHDTFAFTAGHPVRSAGTGAGV